MSKNNPSKNTEEKQGIKWKQHNKSPEKHRKKSGYASWAAMIQRCTNKNNPLYKRYGARGILVCERWRIFANFFSDMGEKPTEKHQLERIDNNGNYEPINCRWATHAEQMRNTSWNVRIEFQGKTMCLSEWAREIGVPVATLAHRLRFWSVEKSLTTKVTKRASNAKTDK